MYGIQRSLPLFVKEETPILAMGASNTAFAVSAPDILSRIEQVSIEWWGKLTPHQQELINGRKDRAMQIIFGADVHFTDSADIFRVRSQSTKGNFFYTVTLAPERRCTCPDFPDAPGHACKHIIAAYFVQKALGMEELDPDPIPETVAEILSQPMTEPEPEPEPACQGLELLTSLRAAQHVIYGRLTSDEYTGLVEILDICEDAVYIRALPQVIAGQLVPVFPFASPFGSLVSWATAIVPKGSFTDVKVYKAGEQ